MLLIPYWRLSGYYFFYFAFVGVFSPYFGLYLQSLSFSAWDISVLLTQMQLMRLVGPFFWSAFVDKLGHRILVIRLTGVATLGIFSVFFITHRFEVLLVTLAVFAFFWVATLPLVETLTFDHLRNESARYNRIRLWGSVGFIITVLGVGLLLDHRSPASMLWICALSLAGVMLCSLSIPEASSPHSGETRLPIGRILRQPRVRVLLVACLAMSAAHGALNIFYAIFLSDHGYDKLLVGGLWTLGVLAEIVVFYYMARIMRHFGLRYILLISLGAAVIRFVAIGQWVDHLTVLVLTQLLHGLTFGAFHSAAITAVSRWFPGNTRSRGQALYSSVSFGAGGIIGGLASGWTWEYFGGEQAFVMSSLFALVGLVLIQQWFFDEDVDKDGK